MAAAGQLRSEALVSTRRTDEAAMAALSFVVVSGRPTAEAAAAATLGEQHTG